MGPVKKGSCEKNSTFTLSDVERLMNEELDNVTQASCVRHAEKLQEDDFLKEIGRDTILEPIIINFVNAALNLRVP